MTAGLSLLLLKLWRNRQGYSTDMVTAARSAVRAGVGFLRLPVVGQHRVRCVAR
jgi:hypothetical protein